MGGTRKPSHLRRLQLKMNSAIWISLLFAILLVAVAIRRLLSRQARRETGLDDAAIERILSHGQLTTPDDEPLDEDEIARAEEEFWEESWDEPEEYGR